MGLRVGDRAVSIKYPEDVGIIDYYNDKKLTHCLRGDDGTVLQRFHPLSYGNSLFKKIDV